MSRTHKDKAWRFHKCDEFPPSLGGAWSIGRWTKRNWWKKMRRKVKTDLQKLETPPPTRTRNSLKWEVW